MTRARPAIAARYRMAGLSLIELMIALVLALIVAAGIITVFASTSSSNKAQVQMATLQEEGRFAIHNLSTDLANANGAYCSNSGGNAGVTGSGLYLDALRSPTVYSEAPLASLFPDNTVTLVDPTGAYSLPSSMFMRGYDCPATGDCTPSGLTALAPGIPPMGTAINDRVPGTDVLTVRYLKPGSGWAITPLTQTSGSHISVVGGTTTVTLSPLTGEEPANDFKSSLMMLADCSNAQVFAVSGAGSGTLTVLGTGNPGNYFQPHIPPPPEPLPAAMRAFDFINDFQTVTYFVQVVDAGNGHTTGELVRRVNGVNQPLVRGVERLDFKYGIIDANGNTKYLDATDVDSATDCPPDVSTVGGMSTDGCMWRAVQTIEVHVLMDGQTPLYTLTPAELNYIYSPDCASGAACPPTAPSAHPIQPKATQGFPDHLIRREFTTVVALRNFNP